MQTKFHPIVRQRGISLIEVMIATAVFATGMLALSMVQNESLRVAQSNHFRGQATMMSKTIFDRIRANPFAGKDGFYRLSKGNDLNEPKQNCFTGTVNCTAQQMAEFDLYKWRQSIVDLLPAGDVEVTSENIDLDGSSATTFDLVVQYKATVFWTINDIDEQFTLSMQQ
jgi:type IV pilus assembly protein PilV